MSDIPQPPGQEPNLPSIEERVKRTPIPDDDTGAQYIVDLQAIVRIEETKESALRKWKAMTRTERAQTVWMYDTLFS